MLNDVPRMHTITKVIPENPTMRTLIFDCDFDVQPGQFVKKDSVLFKIEPEQFEAAVTAAEGNLAKAKADLEIAETNAKRRRDAFERNQAVSEIDVLSAEAEQAAAEAAVSIADAALADAKRDLSYTAILSPVAGRASRDLVDVGNLVGAGESTLLTTVIQDDPVYFNFEVNERTILPFLKNRPNSEAPEINTDVGETLQLTLSDGTRYPLPGKLDFIDNAVDPESGTVGVRAVFKNPEGALADSLFARIGIPEVIENAVLVPRATVQRDLGGSFILVVGEDNKVSRRVVIPTAFTIDEERIIEPFDEEAGTGIKPDDRIVVSNLQRARPGIEVAPSEAKESAQNGEPAPESGGEAEAEAEAEPEAETESEPESTEQN